MFNFLKKKNEDVKTEIVINSIAKGKQVPLEQVNDPVFSNKMMGDGVAIQVEDDTIVAPISGTITLIAETKHAFGITTSEGIEIMVHVGLETVNLKGQGFEKLKEVGETVQPGDPILRIDREFMESQNVELITPVIVLNTMEHTLHHTTNDTVDVNSKILSLTKD